MPNPYFKFKQFTVSQNKCAMKVCTDACLLGAWAVRYVEQGLSREHNELLTILDIGTGTGLLALMLAQKLPAIIDAIEIDDQACLQAKDNIEASPWADRINIIHADIKRYDFIHKKYQLIISNPPFYENDLRSISHVSNMAKHDETLTMKELLSVAALHLLPVGSLLLLLPYHRLDYCIKTAGNHDLFPIVIVNVKQSQGHHYFRSMIVFKNSLPGDTDIRELTIKDGRNYTSEFVELLKDYYLFL